MAPNTLEQAYVEHRRGLFALALSITRSNQGAEDAVQEAFARLCQRRTRTERDLVAYVFAAVRNAALDQAARHCAPPSPASSLFNGHAPDPRTEAERAERDRRLRQALDNLPQELRETIVLRVHAGLTYEQVAQICGAPLQTVVSRYQRGLERLKSSLGARP